jgi:hypothetical protein
LVLAHQGLRFGVCDPSLTSGGSDTGTALGFRI